MTIQSNFPNISPSLNLDFANVEALDPRITFTRASTATYYGTQTAKAEENLVLQSQAFDITSVWTATNVSVSANTTVAPDGTTTADTLTDNATSGNHRILINATLIANQSYAASVFVQAGTHNFVQLLLRDGAVSNRYITVVADLSTQTISQTAVGTSGTLTSSGITSVGNNWYRIAMVGFLSTVSAGQLAINFAPAASGNSISIFGTIEYAGTGTTFSAWGAQLEQRSAVTAYTATTTQPITNYIPVLQTALAGVPRFDHNPTTFESLGFLVEEQRSNLKTYSEDLANVSGWGGLDSPTITINSNVAPDGTLTADLLDDTSTSVVQGREGSASITSGTGTYTASCFIKRYTSNCCSMRLFTNGGTPVVAEVVIDPVSGLAQWRTGVSGTSFSITPVGNNWFRCSLTITDNATGATVIGLILRPAFAATYTPTINVNATGSAFFWGAQLEAGAFPTSYIPTVASQVTRSADAASMTGANFSSWYRADEGTVYFESQTAQGNAATIYSFFGSNTNNRITTNYLSSLRIESSTRINGVFEGNAVTASGTAPLNTFGKGASAYKVNDFGFSWNGATTLTDTSTTLPEVILLSIGGVNALSGNFLNGTIKRLTYYPARLTNAQLQAITG